MNKGTHHSVQLPEYLHAADVSVVLVALQVLPRPHAAPVAERVLRPRARFVQREVGPELVIRTVLVSELLPHEERTTLTVEREPHVGPLARTDRVCSLGAKSIDFRNRPKNWLKLKRIHL